MEKRNVYESIRAVQASLAKEGIGKNRKNQQQGYSFRGIDDVFNALAPLLAESGLVIIPRMLARECVERQAKGGGALFNVTVEAEFDLVGQDGSKHTARTFGEAMDSADKATNKAMSAAYKYMCFQLFAIPTEGDNDADATTPDVSSAQWTPDTKMTAAFGEAYKALGKQEYLKVLDRFKIGAMRDLKDAATAQACLSALTQAMEAKQAG